MDDEFGALEGTLRRRTARGRAAIEAELFPRRTSRARLRRALMQAAGAVAVGTFAAGVSVFLAVVILNFIFHYAPG
ncbi:hypothetical protein V8J36_04170 [Frigidibacter sp. MR17.14]|uniref:hypothetical protein n=1 Tax=Frigidibacter sp. MR17.14 TaxID=3126509 RepID=UPI003012F0EB